MITLSVTAYNGAGTAPLVGHFDETGGNIGRAEGNQLVLPDPERTISRVHAQVVFRGGGYAIVDRGSNPISVNGRVLGNGQEAAIHPGDEIEVGGYTLRVEQPIPPSASASDDPFAAFGGLAAPAAPIAPPVARSSGSGRSGPAATSRSSAGSVIPADWDPFAADAPMPTPVNDFARGLGAPPSFGQAAAPAGTPLIPEFGAPAGGGADSIDALFGLQPSASGDPLAGSALGATAAPPLGTLDPLAVFGAAPVDFGAPMADAVPELNAPFKPPRAQASAPAAAATPRPAAPRTYVSGFAVMHEADAATAAPVAASVADPVLPADAVVSWNLPSGESETIVGDGPAVPASPRATARIEVDTPFDITTPDLRTAAGLAPADSAPPAPSSASPQPAEATSAASAKKVSPASPRVTPNAPPAWQPPPGVARPAGAVPLPAKGPEAGAAATPDSDIAALTAALREGLGKTTLPADAIVLTPELMRVIGSMVAEATRGTVELLGARAALKREIRADVTVIEPRQNNPLKFAASPEAALGHLLSPPARGFLPGDQAMRDAYDDLRAHQFAFLAGMRAALEGILKRFDPAELEARLTAKSILSTLLPAKRKARLWDVFAELYGQISSEASDDFHELFGKEFLRAYNEYVEQLGG